MRREPNLSAAIESLNATTIEANSDLEAKVLMSQQITDELSDAGYEIINLEISYIPVYDATNHPIGHSTESYIVEPGGQPKTFTFTHDEAGKAYTYSAYISVVQSVHDANKIPKPA